MGRSMLIYVGDDNTLVEKVRTFGQAHGVGVQVYSHSEWAMRSGESHGYNSGMTSTESSSQGAKILPFPGSSQPSSRSYDKRVKTINELESEAIEKAIFEFNGNLTEAAKALGIGRATLYRKVKQYNIDPSTARKKRAA